MKGFGNKAAYRVMAGRMSERDDEPEADEESELSEEQRAAFGDPSAFTEDQLEALGLAPSEENPGDLEIVFHGLTGTYSRPLTRNIDFMFQTPRGEWMEMSVGKEEPVSSLKRRIAKLQGYSLESFSILYTVKSFSRELGDMESCNFWLGHGNLQDRRLTSRLVKKRRVKRD